MYLYVRLGNNNVGDAGAQEILKPLINLTNLAHLDVDLWGNNIGDTSAQELLKPLTHLTNLAHLHVDLNSGNNVGDAGA